MGSQLKVVYRPLKSIVPYAKNSRQHPASQIAKIMGSLAEYGWTNAMLVADDVMIAGHARLTAAINMAEQHIDIPGNADPWKGPTIDLSHLDSNQRAAYVITDNRTALDGEWDQELLAEELGFLSEEGFDLSLTGFEADELSTMLAGIEPGDGPDPDDIPEVPVHPVTEPGDIWILGGKVICPKCGGTQ